MNVGLCFLKNISGIFLRYRCLLPHLEEEYHSRPVSVPEEGRNTNLFFFLLRPIIFILQGSKTINKKYLHSSLLHFVHSIDIHIDFSCSIHNNCHFLRSRSERERFESVRVPFATELCRHSSSTFAYI